MSTEFSPESKPAGLPTAVTKEEAPAGKASALFDLRVLIGGLFTFYGVLLLVAGLFASDAELHKADDINMNLWLGIIMLAVGLFFLAWWRLRPFRHEAASSGASEGGPPPRPRGH